MKMITNIYTGRKSKATAKAPNVMVKKRMIKYRAMINGDNNTKVKITLYNFRLLLKLRVQSRISTGGSAII